ncbi:MAG: class D sortase [Thermoanaerobaculia bacterium]
MDSTALPRKRTRLRWLERGLLVIALLCLGSWAWAWLDSSYSQYRENQIFDEALARETAPAATAASETDALGSFHRESSGKADPLDEGDLVGRIEISRIGVSSIVLEGVGNKTLRRGVGHIPDTALPEDGGNVGLAAHRDSFFRGLKDVRKNDIITFKTLQGTYEYRVESTEVVNPKDTHVLADQGAPALTLVTCYPFHYVGSAPKRFIVHARRIEEPGAS